jgi:galactose mutarotase-like enzyme
MEWTVGLAGRATRSVLHWPRDADLDNIAKVRGGNPVLFPFAGRTFHRGRENCWQAPGSREVLPMPRHGFARDGRFRLVRCDDRGFAAELEPTEADASAYPYAYKFMVGYTFQDLMLSVDFTLENRGETPMPWSAGHHFYFEIPWHADLDRGAYVLNLPQGKAFRHAPDGSLVKADAAALAPSLDDTDLVDRIHTRLKASHVTVGPRGGEEDITLRWHHSGGDRKHLSLVTWTSDPEAPFYCIEPWMGPPNAAEHHRGLHFVQPGDQATYSVEISLL